MQVGRKCQWATALGTACILLLIGLLTRWGLRGPEPVQTEFVSAAPLPEPQPRPATTLVLDWPESEREEASLEIDGESVGLAASRVVQYPCAPGQHVLTARRRDYQPFQATLVVAEGEVKTVRPAWQPLPETMLAIVCGEIARADIALKIDGAPLENVAADSAGAVHVACTPGQHTITAERQGFHPFSQIVNAPDHETTIVRLVWRPFPPTPTAPPQDALLDNGSRDGTKTRSWEFRWSALPQTTAYHLRVTPPGSSLPLVDQPQLTEPCYRLESNRTVEHASLRGWKWQVRASVAGQWTDWSKEIVFHVNPVRRHLPPNPDQQQSIAQRWDEEHQIATLKTSKEKLDLARRLLEQSDVVVDPPHRFVQLRRAMEIAADRDDVELVLAAIDKIALDFEVNSVQVKMRVFHQMAKDMISPKSIQTLVEGSAAVRTLALANGDYELAQELDEALSRACAHSGVSPNTRKAARGRRDASRELCEAWQKVQQAQATVQNEPHDPEANGVLGQWYCLHKGNWTEGLPYLAKGADEKLRSAARVESSSPKQAAAQIQLGSLWFDVGKSHRGYVKNGCLLRAMHWYLAAAQSADSDALCAVADKQLEAIAAMASNCVDLDVDRVRREIASRLTFRLDRQEGPAVRVGEIRSLGKTYKVAAVDTNRDGRYDDREKGALLIDLDRDGVLESSEDSAEYHSLGAPFNIHGKVWEIAALASDGSLLTLRPSAAKVEMRPYLKPGCPAVPFTGQGLDGATIDLKQMAAKSKYILLDFWGDWCPYCRQQYESLKMLNAKYRDRGLQIIGINADADRQDAFRVVLAKGLAYPHVYNGRGFSQGVFGLYRVKGIPTTFLLDKDLNIIARDLRGSRLEDRVRQLLGAAD